MRKLEFIKLIFTKLQSYQLGTLQWPMIPKILIKQHKNFIDGIVDISDIQENKLKEILKRNRDCPFGKKFGFSSINNIKDFQSQVPISEWEDIRPYTIQNSIGKSSFLTSDSVTYIVPTSGTTDANKNIPYTEEFLKEYRKGLFVWLADLYIHHPSLQNLKTFWSISPPVAETDSKTGDSFPDDLLYFGRLAPWIADSFAFNPDLFKISSYTRFMDQLATSLVACNNLGFISVWHPSYLIAICEYIIENKNSIVKKIFDGKVNINSDTLDKTSFRNRSNAIAKLFADESNTDFTLLWTDIQLISCWADSEASYLLPELKKRFPGIKIQPKGLLATEGIMTIPIEETGGSIPAYQSHFFEFLDTSGEMIPISELEVGNKYSILMTTSGGLYRYKIGDRVQVSGKYKSVPVLSFNGRENTIDLCGEKLSFTYILKCIDELFKKFKISPVFYLFAPENMKSTLKYLFFIDHHSCHFEEMEIMLDQLLCDSFYYDHARRTGQLDSIEIIRIENGLEKYRNALLKEGQLLGNIKYTHISMSKDWRSQLCSSTKNSG